MFILLFHYWGTSVLLYSRFVAFVCVCFNEGIEIYIQEQCVFAHVCICVTICTLQSISSALLLFQLLDEFQRRTKQFQFSASSPWWETLNAKINENQKNVEVWFSLHILGFITIVRKNYYIFQRIIKHLQHLALF